MLLPGGYADHHNYLICLDTEMNLVLLEYNRSDHFAFCALEVIGCSSIKRLVSFMKKNQVDIKTLDQSIMHSADHVFNPERQFQN